MPTIDILHVPGCDNLDLARSRVRQAIASLAAEGELHEHVVDTDRSARRLGMAGSPTILVDGRDVVDPGEAGMSLACRLYRTADGLDGAPSVEAIVSALRAAMHDR